MTKIRFNLYLNDCFQKFGNIYVFLYIYFFRTKYVSVDICIGLLVFSYHPNLHCSFFNLCFNRHISCTGISVFSINMTQKILFYSFDTLVLFIIWPILSSELFDEQNITLPSSMSTGYSQYFLYCHCCLFQR